jgi:predicted nucleotidyltransferase
MAGLHLEELFPSVAERIKPLLDEILEGYSDNVHSVHIVGSAVTEDFDEKTSDVNSIFVLKQMDLKFIELIAPLGKKYGKKKIAAPLIMTPDYILRSLDVFPIEFHDFRLIHKTVLGEDILNTVEINLSDLRNQCEREIKSKLIGLRQGYISAQGDKKLIMESFVRSISGYMPLFRGIILLMGKIPPVRKHEVIASLSGCTGIDTGIFNHILEIKRGHIKPGKEELDTVFENYYEATEKIGKLIDEHQV